MIPLWQIIILLLVSSFALGLFRELWNDFRYGERRRKKILRSWRQANASNLLTRGRTKD